MVFAKALKTFQKSNQNTMTFLTFFTEIE